MKKKSVHQFSCCYLCIIEVIDIVQQFPGLPSLPFCLLKLIRQKKCSSTCGTGFRFEPFSKFITYHTEQSSLEQTVQLAAIKVHDCFFPVHVMLILHHIVPWVLCHCMSSYWWVFADFNKKTSDAEWTLSNWVSFHNEPNNIITARTTVMCAVIW